MKKLLALLLLITFTVVAVAKGLEGTGYGKTSKEARNGALDDLSQQIRVTVESTYTTDKSFTNGETKEDIISSINIVSKNDLLGVEYKTKKYFLRKKYRVIAKIDADKLDLYEDKAELHKNYVNLNVKKSESTETLQGKKELLEKSLNDLDYFEGYSSIAMILGSDKTFSVNYTRGDLEGRIARIDNILNAPKVMLVTLTGDYPSEAYDYIKNNVDNLISTLSKNSSTKLVIAREMNEEVNTLFNVNVNSYYIDLTDPVTYNDKEIIGEKYEASINITITAKDKNIEGYLINKTSDAKAYDFNSRKSAMFKAVNTLFTREEEELKDSFSF